MDSPEPTFAAILTADMVGFSGRMRSDEETVISLLIGTYYRLALEAAGQFSGKVFRREGDAVWCSFTEPRQAIEAGLWLLSSLGAYNAKRTEKKQIRVRIGVAWGPVTYPAPASATEAPMGPTLSMAKRLENTASWDSLQLCADLLEEVPGERVHLLARSTLPGEDVHTACIQPSAAYEKEMAAGRRPPSALAWVFALDFTQVPAQDGREWLRWAVMVTQTRGAQVYEWQDHHHLLVWPARGELEPWPGAHAGRLPFPPLPEVRCTLAVGEVVMAALEALEGPSLVGSTVERALELLELAPQDPGLWCDASVAERLGPRWNWSRGYDPEGQVVLARDPAPAFQNRPPPTESQGTLQQLLAQALSKGRGAVVVTGPWIGDEQLGGLRQRLGLGEQDSLLEALEEPGARAAARPFLSSGALSEAPHLAELGVPIFTCGDESVWGSGQIALPHPDMAWERCSADPHLDGLLRRGELLWICCPGCEDWLKLIYADFEYRFANRRPGVLLHPEWEERHQRRWLRRGFQLVPVTHDRAALWEWLHQLIQWTRFRGQVRHQQRQLSRMPSRPYKFLNYYTREDRAIFFGRDEEIQRIKKRMLSGWLLVLFGRSGVGKTSLIRAGLLSHFQAPHDMVFAMRMLSDPVISLRAMMCRMLGLEVENQNLGDLFALAESRVSGRVIVIIDQFEEYFLRCSTAQRCHFEDQLAGLMGLDLRRTHVVLSLREDFLAHMSELEYALPGVLRQRFRVSALSREQARQAILRPAHLFQLELEAQVVDDLLLQLDQGGIEPPQLQIVLDRLYDHRLLGEDGASRISWDSYQAVGGAQALLRGYFEEALQTSLGPEKERARLLLKHMVTKRRTKAVVTVEELRTALGWPLENLTAVLKLLVESRLVRSWQEEDRGSYELAHDFLTQEIATWQTPQEIAIKHAMMVLRNEMRNFQKLGVLMPADRLALLQEQASLLSPGPAERAMLVRASVLRGLDPAPWMGDEPDSSAILLQLLEEGVEGDIARSVIAYLCRYSLDEWALARVLRAARQFGNPHLLERLKQVPTALLEALRGAVHERFFGPQAMVLVAAGTAWVGSTRDCKEARKVRLRRDLHERIESESDLHQVVVEAFYIDRLLVSNSAYSEFRPMHVHFFPPHEFHLPAVNVSYDEAWEYAHWLGKRLPSEEQWEKAARGEDGRLFPWGNTFDSNLVNSAESGLRAHTSVVAYPEGASPYGCLNMAGNVWEWTTTPWEPDSPLRVKKGGCALSFEPSIHCSARFEDPPEMRLRWGGFRLIS